MKRPAENARLRETAFGEFHRVDPYGEGGHAREELSSVVVHTTRARVYLSTDAGVPLSAELERKRSLTGVSIEKASLFIAGSRRVRGGGRLFPGRVRRCCDLRSALGAWLSCERNAIHSRTASRQQGEGASGRVWGVSR